MTADGSSSRAHPPTWSLPAPTSPASTSRPTSAGDRRPTETWRSRPPHLRGLDSVRRTARGRGPFRRGFRSIGSAPKVLLQPVDVLLAHLVDVDQLVARPSNGVDQLVMHDLGLLRLTIGFEQDQDAE